MPEHQQTQQSKKPNSFPQRRSTLIVQTPISNPAAIIQHARIDPKSLTPADVLQLQHTIGNRAVGRLLSEIRRPSMVQKVTIQRQELEEEETCPSCVQRQETPEEDETIQGKFETIQRLEPEDEEKLQMKSVVQRQEIPEEEELIQGKMIGTIQRQEISEEEESLQPKRENNTGMPYNLKAGVESLSGIDMSDVRVHYNSSKPAKVGALAYAQGTNIHVAPGQERHLPHEAWHVVQMAQGRVRPTIQLKDFMVNDDVGLESEANEMGKRANEKQNNGIELCSKLPMPETHRMQSGEIIQSMWIINKNGEREWVEYEPSFENPVSFESNAESPFSLGIPEDAAGWAQRAVGDKDLFRELSAEMCWDAVIICVRKAGIKPRFDGNRLISETEGELVIDANSIPRNNVIGFFADHRLIHSMLSIGNGLAAGNKNSCIGIGNPVGWEILNLNYLGFGSRVEDTTFRDSYGNQWDILDSGKSQTSLISRLDGTFIDSSNRIITVRHKPLAQI